MPNVQDKRDINATRADLDARDAGRFTLQFPPIQTPTQAQIVLRDTGRQ